MTRLHRCLLIFALIVTGWRALFGALEVPEEDNALPEASSGPLALLSSIRPERGPWTV